MKIQITGGRVIDPSQNLDEVLDLYIAEGKVVAVGDCPAGFEADQQIDASGQVVCPGLVDLQANLCEPGATQKGTIATELAAAAAGGVTTLCCPPTTSPVMDTPAVVRLVTDKSEDSGLARVLPLGAMTKGLESEQLANMVALSEAGCVALSNGAASVASNQTLLRCFEYAATFDLLLYLRPGDKELSLNGCAHEGETSFRMGLAGIAETAETLDVARFLLLAEQTGVRIHLGQLSTARAVEMVADAQQRGIQVSADVAMPNLLLTDKAIVDYDSAYHLSPPLRTEQDRRGLIQGLQQGTLAAICSAHQPQDAAAKQAPFAATEAGMIGLQTLLSLGLQLVESGDLELPRLLERLTQGPAMVLGQPFGFAPGACADICIFDPALTWTFDDSSNLSKAANSPYFNETLQGRVTHTLYQGRVVFQL